jgi:excisionase family DNA binding protein
MPPLLTEREAAAILKVSVRTLERWRVSGLGLRFVVMGHSVRYHPDELSRFVAAQSRASTSEERR